MYFFWVQGVLNSLLDTEFWHPEVWCDADGKHEYTLKPNWTAQQANGPTRGRGAR